MKFLLIALLACVAISAAEHLLNLSEEQRAHVRAFSNECREKEDITAAEANSIRDGHFDNVTPKGKCFVNCFLEKVGFFANGAVVPDVVSTKLTPLVGADKHQQIVEKCNGIHGDEKCETAYKLYKCYYENHASML